MTDPDLRSLMRRLEGPNGVMTDSDRLLAIWALMDTMGRAVRYGEKPERHHLIRVAAHALVWAKELES